MLRQLDDAFAAMTQAGADALIVFGEPQLIVAPRADCGPRRHESATSDVCHERCMWRPGASCPMGQACSTCNRRAAVYVDKILKGAKPADLPVEQPTKFELVINLKAAKAIDLPIPPSVLFQAGEVIQ